MLKPKYTKAISRRILKYRRTKGISQEQLAKRARICRATLVGLEHGASDPRLSTVLRLAKIMELPLGDLLS